MGGMFGPYELVEHIGSGGMAEVWRARTSVHGGEPVWRCIKRLRPELEGIAGLGKMLLKEGRISSKLTHRAIVQTRLAGDIDGITFVEMDLVDGRDLARLLARLRESGATLPPRVVAWIASETLAALEHAHDAGVVHRDISPQNILLAWDGRVLLTDFGIAAVRERARTTMQRAAAVGATGPGALSASDLRPKTAYLSPEQAAGDPGGPRSDLYSLGVVLWECLAGRRLFAPSVAPGIGAGVPGEPPPPPGNDAPPALAALAGRLLEPRAADRPASATAAIRQLTVATRELWPDDAAGDNGGDSAWSPRGGWQAAAELVEVLETCFGAERAVDGQVGTLERTKPAPSQAATGRRMAAASRGKPGPDQDPARVSVHTFPAALGGSTPAPRNRAPRHTTGPHPAPAPPPATAPAGGTHWMWYAAAGSAIILLATLLATSGGC